MLLFYTQGSTSHPQLIFSDPVSRKLSLWLVSSCKLAMTTFPGAQGRQLGHHAVSAGAWESPRSSRSRSPAGAHTPRARASSSDQLQVDVLAIHLPAPLCSGGTQGPLLGWPGHTSPGAFPQPVLQAEQIRRSPQASAEAPWPPGPRDQLPGLPPGWGRTGDPAPAATATLSLSSRVSRILCSLRDSGLLD